jgi:hypothetical protein
VQNYTAQGLYGSAPAVSGTALALSPFTIRKLLKPGAFGGTDGAYEVGNSPTSDQGLGGGTVSIIASGAVTITGTGSINANGTAGIADNTNCYGAGGGGGGWIIIASKTSISNSGTLNASGGQGSTGNTTCATGGTTYGIDSAAGGGGGVIHLLAPSITAGTEDVGGGAIGSGSVHGEGYGFGGGPSGGNGGTGTGEAAGGSLATAGSTGLVFNSIVTDPATVFLP